LVSKGQAQVDVQLTLSLTQLEQVLSLGQKIINGAALGSRLKLKIKIMNLYLFFILLNMKMI
jgi:hypothetical protein